MSIAKDKANVAASIDKVQSYEEAFNKIKAATGISDIQELVNTFIANEDQNFSLFNYVNEQVRDLTRFDFFGGGLPSCLLLLIFIMFFVIFSFVFHPK